jgi:hypothetical protein
MGQQECIWSFAIFHQEFRKHNPIAFEGLMVLAIAHLFGFYNPKPFLSPYLKFQLDITHTEVHIRRWSRGDMQYGLEEIAGVNLGVDQ